MLRRRLTILMPLLLAAAPAVAQEPPDVRRLEALRLERMREALDLTEEQIRALRSGTEELRRRGEELRRGQRQSMERLGQALRSEPVDEAAVAEALESVERRRAEVERLRAEHRRRLAEVLNPEQRARFLLFNHHFDSRLRELIQRRRGAAPGAPGCPPACDDGGRRRPPTGVVPPGERLRPLERRLEAMSPDERRREIDRLRDHLRQLERRLEEMEGREP